MGFLRVIIISILLTFTMCSSKLSILMSVVKMVGLHASENYSKWANKMRFLVNDTLTFKYKKETDSVVVVTKTDYDKCNAANPIQKMDGGDSVFKFDRSGPFYFITGNKSNCDQGQKLIIVVLAVRNKYPPPTPSVPAPSPAPVIPGPAVSPAPSANAPGIVPTPWSPGNSPWDNNWTPAPAPSKSFAPAISPAMLVTVVLSVTVAAFITFN